MDNIHECSGHFHVRPYCIKCTCRTLMRMASKRPLVESMSAVERPAPELMRHRMRDRNTVCLKHWVTLWILRSPRIRKHCGLEFSWTLSDDELLPPFPQTALSKRKTGYTGFPDLSDFEPDSPTVSDHSLRLNWSDDQPTPLAICTMKTALQNQLN